MDDLDVKVRESCGIIRESLGIHLIDKRWDLSDESDSEHDSKANFKHGRHKRHETVTSQILEYDSTKTFL